MKTVEIFAAEALENTRLRVWIPAPWFLKIFRIKAVPFFYYRPVYAILLRISKLYVQMDIDITKFEEDGTESKELLPVIAAKGKKASRIIAAGLIRSATLDWWFGGMFARYLRKHLDAKTMAELTKCIVIYSGVESFMTIIRSIAHVKVTTPVLSQTATGS